MNKRTKPTQPTKPRTKTKKKLVPRLFLETSAQVLRLTGPPEIQRGINELVAECGELATSWFVRQEFNHTYVAFLAYVSEAIWMLPEPEQAIRFEDLWESVRYQMPRYYPGGSNLFPKLDRKVNEMFAGQAVSPSFLRNYIEGLKEGLEQNFLRDKFFDHSSCGVWVTPGSCDCYPEPGSHCRLKKTCVAMRDEFLASATTMANSRKKDESRWLSSNLEKLRATNGKAMLELVGKHPGPVGDIIIFWEVPNTWTILTRDTAYKILKNAHREKVRVFIVRAHRLPSGKSCVLHAPTVEKPVSGVVINYHARGARIRAKSITVKPGQVVTISDEFGRKRSGEVVYIDKKDKSAFGLKFTFKQPRINP